MEKLRNRHNRAIESVNLDFKRLLIDQLPWDERLLGIKGSRGVGKTTLMLQYIKENYGDNRKALYVSLDDIYFAENKLIDLAEDFVSRGGEHLFIDEVHKYPNWSVEIKNIYDIYPDLKLLFTSSSLLEILNSRSDLSRRALVYELQGLSFREYLNFNFNLDLPPISLEEIINNHYEISRNLNKTIKPLSEFDNYLQIGYFPFYSGHKDRYEMRLKEIINLIIEIEIPLLRNTSLANVSKIKQLLYIISQSVPFKPNISTLAKKTNITRKTLLEYLSYLSDANVLGDIYKEAEGISLLQKPEKLFLENTNYMFALSDNKPETGSLRETFFFNQLKNNHILTYPDNADFKIDKKYLFEIGGKHKTSKQIKAQENAFIAADNIEFGIDNKIPLWLFGFLY